MKKRLALPAFDHREKELEVSNRDIRLMIDFDDVSHGVVEELTKIIITAINAIPKSEWDAAVLRGIERDNK